MSDRPHGWVAGSAVQGGQVAAWMAVLHRLQKNNIRLNAFAQAGEKLYCVQFFIRMLYRKKQRSLTHRAK